MATLGGHGGAENVLICAIGDKLCALPLGCVIETLRPLPVTPLPHMPEFVRGLCMIRGRPTPLVDARRLLGSDSEREPARIVRLRSTDGAAARVLALAVDAVLGVRRLDPSTLTALPELLRSRQAGLVSELGELDAELLFVLERTHLMPEAAWQRLGAEQASA